MVREQGPAGRARGKGDANERPPGRRNGNGTDARKAAEFQVIALRLKEARRRAWADARLAASTPGSGAADIEFVSGRLSKLARYERHAANMRDKALRELERARAPFGG